MKLPAWFEEHDQETVDSFIEVFDLMDVEHLNDAYMGHYRGGNVGVICV